MNDYSCYPVSYPQPSTPRLVYVPQVANPSTNRAVSVIGIILIIALLFVGMQVFNGKGIIEKDVTWVMGYIDENGESNTSISYDNWFAKVFGAGSTVGMFTSEAIPVKSGVQIDKLFESKYLYKIYCYDEDDAFIGCMGAPRSEDEKLYPDDFNGEFSQTKYIRLFVYQKDGSNMSRRQAKRAENDFTIYNFVVNN